MMRLSVSGVPRLFCFRFDAGTDIREHVADLFDDLERGLDRIGKSLANSDRFHLQKIGDLFVERQPLELILQRLSDPFLLFLRHNTTPFSANPRLRIRYATAECSVNGS